MAKLEFARGSYTRQVAKTPVIPAHNRFIEEIPTLTDGPVSAIARPGLNYLSNAGVGPIRGMFSAPGIFGNKAFLVNGNNFHTVDPATGAQSDIGVISSTPEGSVSWAAVAQIAETVPSRLFFAEGGVLWVYSENSESFAQLQASAIAAADRVVINGVFYAFTAGSVDTGTPAGTTGAPWLVALGANLSEALRNLTYAINDNGGTAGTDYSTATTANTFVTAYAFTSTDVFITATVVGTAGNAYTTTETGANMAWGAGTMGSGGTTRIRQVLVPGDVGATSVTAINGFVIVVPVQAEDLFTTGKFYWINPGEVTIDALDFANAERSSDNILQVLTYQDQYWIFGTQTVESWITTGDLDAPMQRYQGVLIDRGSWEGTAVKVRDSIVFVDEEGGVFQIRGGTPTRVSRPDIEERIRRGILFQGNLPS